RSGPASLLQTPASTISRRGRFGPLGESPVYAPYLPYLPCFARRTIAIPTARFEGIQKPPLPNRKRRRDSFDRGSKLPGMAGKAKPDKPFSAGAERGSRRQADIGVVDQAHAQPSRVRLAINRKKQIKR